MADMADMANANKPGTKPSPQRPSLSRSHTTNRIQSPLQRPRHSPSSTDPVLPYTLAMMARSKILSEGRRQDPDLRKLVGSALEYDSMSKVIQVQDERTCEERGGRQAFEDGIYGSSDDEGMDVEEEEEEEEKEKEDELRSDTLLRKETETNHGVDMDIQLGQVEELSIGEDSQENILLHKLDQERARGRSLTPVVLQQEVAIDDEEEEEEEEEEEDDDDDGGESEGPEFSEVSEDAADDDDDGEDYPTSLMRSIEISDPVDQCYSHQREDAGDGLRPIILSRPSTSPPPFVDHEGDDPSDRRIRMASVTLKPTTPGSPKKRARGSSCSPSPPSMKTGLVDSGEISEDRAWTAMKNLQFGAMRGSGSAAASSTSLAMSGHGMELSA